MAQNGLTGRVLDFDTRQPLAFANVFFVNTTKGVMTDEKGNFTFAQIPKGTSELVVSYIGYETFYRRFEVDSLPTKLTVLLKMKAEALSEVKIKPQKDARWAEHFRLFEQTFLGKTFNAQQCKVLNPKALWFDDDPEKKVLTGGATEMLQIENEALGYKLKYQLENFTYDYGQLYVSYVGYATFEEITPKNERQANRWHQRRQDAYLGSVMHFMRALHKRTIREEGFVVRKIVEQVDTLQKINKVAKKVQMLLPDTLRYRQFIGEHPPDRTMLQFTDLLQVTYTKAYEDNEYKNQTSPSFGRFVDYSKKFQTSTAQLLASHVWVTPDGNYVNPIDLMMEGYWAWKKIADSLPLDYELMSVTDAKPFPPR